MKWGYVLAVALALLAANVQSKATKRTHKAAAAAEPSSNKNQEEELRNSLNALNGPVKELTEEEKVEEKTNLARAFTAFKTTVEAATGAFLPQVDFGMKAFAAVVIDSYSGGKDGAKASIWDQVQNKVLTEIQRSITVEHFDNIRTVFNSFPVLMRKGTKFEETDLARITNAKHEVFPQDEASNFSPLWLPNFVTWLLHVVAGYLQLRENNPPTCVATPSNDCPDACGLLNEMIVIRAELIAAVTSLYKKRMKMLIGTSYSNLQTNLLNLSFMDKQDGSSSTYKVENARRYMDSKIFNVYDTSSKMVAFYNEQVKLVKENDLFKKCQNFSKLEELEVFFQNKWNHRYFGRTVDGQGPCLLPCDKYSDDKDKELWCPTDAILTPSHANYKKLYPAASWGRCTKPEWDSLLKTGRTFPAWLDYKDFPIKEIDAKVPSKFAAPEGWTAGAASTTLMFSGSDLGTWGNTDNCDGRGYVTAFLTDGEYSDSNDAVGMTELRVLCTDGKTWTSRIGDSGSGRSDYVMCLEGYIAAQITSDKQGDDRGIVQVKMKCAANGEFQTPNLDYHLDNKGITVTESCPAGTRICGLKTRTQGDGFMGKGDSAGVTELKLTCCTPAKRWFLL